jgi:hypothetical protein
MGGAKTLILQLQVLNPETAVNIWLNRLYEVELKGKRVMFSDMIL